MTFKVVVTRVNYVWWRENLWLFDIIKKIYAYQLIKCFLNKKII